jgi:hypothetical protein
VFFGVNQVGQASEVHIDSRRCGTGSRNGSNWLTSTFTICATRR